MNHSQAGKERFCRLQELTALSDDVRPILEAFWCKLHKRGVILPDKEEIAEILWNLTMCQEGLDQHEQQLYLAILAGLGVLHQLSIVCERM